MGNKKCSVNNAEALRSEIEVEQMQMDEILKRLEQGDTEVFEDWKKYKASKEVRHQTDSDTRVTDEKPGRSENNSQIGRLKEAIEIQAREYDTVIWKGADITANEILSTVADYADEVSFCSLSFLMRAVMFYMRNSKDSDHCKDSVERELTLVMDNAHLYSTHHEALSILSGAIGSLKEGGLL